jgi:4-diphosphocytidyl-2C-methyl-D-erythritol kinase
MTRIRLRIAARLRRLANRLDAPAASMTIYVNGRPVNSSAIAQATVRVTGSGPTATR